MVEPPAIKKTIMMGPKKPIQINQNNNLNWNNKSQYHKVKYF